MFIAELNHPMFDMFDLTCLRTGIMAGALCPIELMRQVSDKMHLLKNMVRKWVHSLSLKKELNLNQKMCATSAKAKLLATRFLNTCSLWIASLLPAAAKSKNTNLKN